MKQQSSSKGFAVLSSASVVCKVLSFVYLPIQAMLVHDNGNGVIGTGYKLYLFIYALTNAGLPVVISKFVSEQTAIGDYRSARKTFKSAFLLMAAFGVVSFLLTFFGAGWLARDYSHMPEAEMMFRYIAPTFLFTSVSCSLRGYFQGRHNMTPTAISQVIEQIINSALTVTFEVLMFQYAARVGKDTVEYAAAGSAAATAAAALGSALFLSFLFFFVYRIQRRSEYRHQTYEGPEIATGTVYRQILRFSIPAVISCIASSAIDLIDTQSCQRLLLQAKFSAKDAASLFGIYSTKYQRLMTLATMFVAPLVTAMIPTLSAAIAKSNRKYVRYKIRESYKLIYLVIMPVIAGLTFLAKPIITVVFFRQNTGALMLILGTWTAVLMAVQSIQSGVLISFNRPLVSPINTIIGMLLKLLCNYVLIPIHAINIYGAIIGNTLAWVVTIVLNQYAIDRTIRHRLHTVRYLIVPGAASVVMGVFSLGCYWLLFAVFNLIIRKYVTANDIAVFLTIPVGAVIYFALLIKSGGVTVKDLRRFPMGGKLTALLERIPFFRRELQTG